MKHSGTPNFTVERVSNTVKVLPFVKDLYLAHPLRSKGKLWHRVMKIKKSAGAKLNR